MSLSDEQRSQHCPLPSDISDDSPSSDFRGSSARNDENNWQPSAPRRIALEPFTIEGFNLELPVSLYERSRTSVLSFIRQKRGGARLSLHNRRQWLRRIFGRKPRVSRCIFYLIVGYVLILGIIHFLGNVLDTLGASFPDDIDWILRHWGLPGEMTEGFGQWPTDATGDVHPVNCHSHNDYWRSVPLYAAVHAGCTGAEADVWLVGDKLYVGHRRVSLTENRTLQNLYINPLLDLIGKQNPPIRYHPNEDYPLHRSNGNPLNGIFDTDPAQTFVLLIDFKSSGPELWAELDSQLTPLREKGYLTYFNGSAIIERPVTVVGTGNAPFNLLTANGTYRDVFYDAPLQEMADLSSQWPNPNRGQDPTRGHDQRWNGPRTRNALGRRKLVPATKTAEQVFGKSTTLDIGRDTQYGPFNSYYASTSFTKSIGHVFGSRLTQEQLQLIRGQIRGAHQRGLKVRYWALPQWPIGLRNHVWHILIREGVDMLNVDDLWHATRRDWRKRKGWWY